MRTLLAISINNIFMKPSEFREKNKKNISDYACVFFVCLRNAFWSRRECERKGKAR